MLASPTLNVAVLQFPQKENMQLQKYTWSTRPTKSDRLSPKLPSQYSTVFARWYTETPVYICSDTVNAYVMTKKKQLPLLSSEFWNCGWCSESADVGLYSLSCFPHCNSISNAMVYHSSSDFIRNYCSLFFVMTAPLLNHLEHALFLCLSDCFCLLYNLQLLVLSKLAYIGVLASIGMHVAFALACNFRYLCLPLCNTKCITVSIQPCFQSSKGHVHVMMGWKLVQYYIICVSFVKILFYDFHHVLNSSQLSWKFMQENSWVGLSENRKWRCSAVFLYNQKQEVIALPKTFNGPCNFSNSECWFSEMMHFVKCCHVLWNWNVRFCKILYFMKCCCV